MRNIFRKIFKKKLELINMLPPLEGRVSAHEPLKKKELVWRGWSSSSVCGAGE